MSRSLSAGFVSAVQSGSTRPRLFFEGVFSGGTLRLWTGSYDISWNGQTWIGAGNLLAISAVQETLDIRAVNFTVALNGARSTLISTALTQCRQGADGTVWLGLLDASGAVIADPYSSFKGRLDVPDIVDSGETCSISVRYESRLADLERARVRRYTQEDQQIDVADDLGFAFVPSLQDQTITWGPNTIGPVQQAPAAAVAAQDTQAFFGIEAP